MRYLIIVDNSGIDGIIQDTVSCFWEWMYNQAVDAAKAKLWWLNDAKVTYLKD